MIYKDYFKNYSISIKNLLDEVDTNLIDKSVELINLRSIKPWDIDLVSNSVKKTGRLIIADSGWLQGGVAAEISSSITGKMFDVLKCPILRVALPNIPAPCSRSLEKIYYPNSKTIAAAIENKKIGLEKIPSKGAIETNAYYFYNTVKFRQI